MAAFFLIAAQILLLQPSFCLNNVYNYIKKHKHLLNSSVHVLNSGNNETVLQYDYIIENKTNSDRKIEELNVGFLQNANTSLDCGFAENDLFERYSWDVLQHLQQIVKFKIKLNTTTKKDLFLCPEKNSKAFSLHPIFTSRYALIFKYNKFANTKDIFRLTFVGTLWSVFLFIVILLAICLKISTKQYSIIWRKDHPWNWVEITLWAIATVCQQGLSYTPRGFCSHTIFLVGYLTAYLLYTGFAAGITSILVGKDIHRQIDFEQLKMKKVQFFSVDYLKSDFPHDFSVKINYVKSVSELFEILEDKNLVGIVPKIFLEDFMSKNFNYQQVGLYHVVETELKFERSFWIYHKNIAEIFNEKLILMQQAGILQRLRKKYKPVIPESGFESDYSSVGREHVESALFLFSGGVIGSVIFLFAEITYAFYKKCTIKRK